MQLTIEYEDVIVPLFGRIPNLKERILYLLTLRYAEPYIDGMTLSNDVLMQLHKFNFSSIISVWKVPDDMMYPSGDDIQRRFTDNTLSRVGSYADEIPHDNRAWCHVYSLPYAFKPFYGVSGSFLSGLFDQVELLVLNEIRSFEHEFVATISHSFPSLRRLHVNNMSPQTIKQHSLIPVTFPHSRGRAVTR
jgi:hypothetical protein